MVIGSFLFFQGAYIKSYALLIIGRVLFGFGGESVRISNSAIEAQWFSSRELPFAMSVEYALADLGTFAVDSAEPALYRQLDSVPAILLGCFLVTIVGFGACLNAFCLDSKRERDEGGEGEGRTRERERSGLQLRIVKEFSADYWIIMLATTMGLTAISNFNNISSEFFQNRLGFSIQEAGTLMGLESLACAAFSPWVGKFFGYTQHKVKFGTLAVVLSYPGSVGRRNMHVRADMGAILQVARHEGIAGDRRAARTVRQRVQRGPQSSHSVISRDL